MEMGMPRMMKAASITALLPALAYGIWSQFSGESPAALAFLVWASMGYAYSLILLFVFGVPLFLLAHHFRLATWWLALLAGAATALFASAVMKLGPMFVFIPL